MTDIIIRPARPRDLPDILDMVRALSAFHGDVATISLESLQWALFESGQATALLAERRSDVIGYAGLTNTVTLHTGQSRIDIHHLYVAERHRSSGVGRALIDAAKRKALEIGAVGLTIGTDPRNAVAVAAYRAMGLEELTGVGTRFWIPVAA